MRPQADRAENGLKPAEEVIVGREATKEELAALKDQSQWAWEEVDPPIPAKDEIGEIAFKALDDGRLSIVVIKKEAYFRPVYFDDKPRRMSDGYISVPRRLTRSEARAYMIEWAYHLKVIAALTEDILPVE